jgi:hypothetical protein
MAESGVFLSKESALLQLKLLICEMVIIIIFIIFIITITSAAACRDRKREWFPHYNPLSYSAQSTRLS